MSQALALTDYKPFARQRGRKTYRQNEIRFDIRGRSANCSTEPMTLENTRGDRNQNFQPPLETLERISEISTRINNVRLEHKQENWDGYGASPVNIDSLNSADKFLRSLATNVPLPLTGCEPSGRVGVEWITDKMRLTVAFNPDGTISYAGINPQGRIFNGRDKEGLETRIKNFAPASDASAFA